MANGKITEAMKLKDLAEGTLAIFQEELATKEKLSGLDDQILRVSKKVAEQAEKQTFFGQASLKVEQAIFNFTKRKKEVNGDFLEDLFKANKSNVKSVNLSKQLNNLYGLADDLLGGMLGSVKGFINPFTATAAIAIAFSGTLDEIGGRFGAIGIQSLDVRNSLMDAQVEATKLGKSMSDVLDATTQLTSEFGVGLSEALKLSSSVIDTSVALGISTTEAGDLIGSFKALAGLSADQATALAKNVTLLAKANDVAPQQILRDIAGSSEAIAGFTDTTGTNIARAAIQARRLGISLSDVASSAKSLLDFQSTYQKSLEASVLIGRNINVERMMELSLAGDLEGLQKEQIKQLGTQSEFNKLNILQREALANAVGLSLDQAAKLVNKEKEAVTLAGQLAGQPGFDELVGEKGISSLTRLTGSLKSLGATLTNSLGPILNVVLKLLVGVGKVLEFVLEPFNMLFRGINTGMENIVTPSGIPSLQSGGLVTQTGVAKVHAGESVGVFNEKAIVDAIENMSDKLGSLQLNTKITNKDLNVVLTPSKA
tara:strand:- start:600 stop:2225 length:1626 start_codon:yes stop_codon:yes gene_type:complete